MVGISYGMPISHADIAGVLDVKDIWQGRLYFYR